MRRTPLVIALLAPLIAPAWAQGLRITPLGFCSLGSISSAVNITATNCVFASLTGVISNGILTASPVTGPIGVRQPLIGTGVPAGTVILSQVSGTPRGAGTYTIGPWGGQPNTTLSVGSESMTTAGTPPTANYASICASTQAVNYRSDGGTATATAGSGGQPIPAGSCIPATTTFSLMSFIQQSATAVLGIEFFILQ